MPRLTVIDAEATYKERRAAFEADPGAYRSASDFCAKCWRQINPAKLAADHGISVDFALEQLGGIAQAEGHWDDYHPEYWAGDYRCAQCGRELEEDRDGYE